MEVGGRRRGEVEPPVGVDAGNDEEEPRALGAATAETPQPENHGALVFLDNLGSRGGGCRWYKPHLDTTPDGDGEGDDDKDVREEGDEGGHAAVLLNMRGCRITD